MHRVFGMQWVKTERQHCLLLQGTLLVLCADLHCPVCQKGLIRRYTHTHTHTHTYIWNIHIDRITHKHIFGNLLLDYFHFLLIQMSVQAPELPCLDLGSSQYSHMGLQFNLRSSGIKFWTILCSCLHTGFPGGSVVKNPSANAGDAGLIPGWRRSPGEGNGKPLQYSCL